MASYSKISDRNQDSISRILGAIEGAFYKKQQDEALKQYLGLLSNAQRQTKKVYQPEEIQPDKLSQPTMSPMQMLAGDKLGVPKETVTNNNLNTMGMPSVNLSEKPPVTKPKELYNPQTNVKDYNTATNKANEIAVNLITQLSSNPNITPEKINQGLSMLQMLRQGPPRIPKFDTKQLGDYAITYDEYGNEIKKEKTKQQKNEYEWTTIGTGTKNGKKIATQENKVTGERREVELGEKDSGITIDNKSVSDLMRKMNIENVVGEVSGLEEEYKLYEDKEKTETDSVKKGQYSEGKKLIMKDIIAKTDQLTQAISEQFPSFYPTIEAYLNDPELIADPSRIDKVVSEDLKGVDQNLIRLTKKIVKARIFGNKK